MELTLYICVLFALLSQFGIHGQPGTKARKHSRTPKPTRGTSGDQLNIRTGNGRSGRVRAGRPSRAPASDPVVVVSSKGGNNIAEPFDYHVSERRKSQVYTESVYGDGAGDLAALLPVKNRRKNSKSSPTKKNGRKAKSQQLTQREKRLLRKAENFGNKFDRPIKYDAPELVMTTGSAFNGINIEFPATQGGAQFQEPELATPPSVAFEQPSIVESPELSIPKTHPVFTTPHIPRADSPAFTTPHIPRADSPMFTTPHIPRADSTIKVPEVRFTQPHIDPEKFRRADIQVPAETPELEQPNIQVTHFPEAGIIGTHFQVEDIDAARVRIVEPNTHIETPRFQEPEFDTRAFEEHRLSVLKTLGSQRPDIASGQRENPQRRGKAGRVRKS